VQLTRAFSLIIKIASNATLLKVNNKAEVNTRQPVSTVVVNFGFVRCGIYAKPIIN
jgi:hypothetical protein